jgi:hypothetical protein
VRSPVIATALLATSLLGLLSFAHAQTTGKDACASMCDCNNLLCIDFCSPSSCGRPTTCRKKFDKMVRECEKACRQCQSLQRSKKP